MESTRPSLLERIRDLRDQASWAEFVELYGPFILRVVRRLGVSHEDALDVVQETLSLVADRIGQFEYDPSRSFRAWLATIARNKARRVKPAPPGGTAHLVGLHRVADPADEHEEWIEQEWCRWRTELALNRARSQLSDKVWECFRLAVLEGLSDQEVADRQGISIGYVYVCKCRARREIKEALDQIDDEPSTP